MKAFRNLVHLGVLVVLGGLGVLLTVKALFAGAAVMGALAVIAGFWMWFAAYAGATTFLVHRFESAFLAPVVHGGLYLLLHMLPRELPFSLLRLGYDLLAL